MKAQLIGKVRSTRSGKKIVVDGREVGGPGRDGRHWYDVKAHSDGTIRCSCPAWKYQRLAPSLRSCKHIAKFAEVRRSGASKTNDVIVYCE